jgi:hypothetical protein
MTFQYIEVMFSNLGQDGKGWTLAWTPLKGQDYHIVGIIERDGMRWAQILYQDISEIKIDAVVETPD